MAASNYQRNQYAEPKQKTKKTPQTTRRKIKITISIFVNEKCDFVFIRLIDYDPRS